MPICLFGGFTPLDFTSMKDFEVRIFYLNQLCGWPFNSVCAYEKMFFIHQWKFLIWTYYRVCGEWVAFLSLSCIFSSILVD
jgi:hypothetical protein